MPVRARKMRKAGPMTLFCRARGLALGIVFSFLYPTGFAASAARSAGAQNAPPADQAPAAGAQQQPGAPPAGASERQQSASLLITVADENRVPVPLARVVLVQAQGGKVFQGETDYAGRVELAGLPAGAYRLRVEKEGFYAVALSEVRVGETEAVEVTLNHQQEYVESVDVVYSPPSIDPAKTTSNEVLGSQEIVRLPYSVTRDIRYALPLLPGVLQDAFGQLHVAGASTREVVDQLDGFNITDSGTGQFNMRVNVDAIRAVDVSSSRYPVEYGKGSGGVISLKTGMGDNRFRYSATDLVPGFQSRKGVHLQTWTPRGTFSGPLRKGNAWFLLAPDGEYHLDIIDELPRGQDQNPVWRVSNLAKAQVNLKQSNILTGSFLVNRFNSANAGLSRFSPLETTVNLRNFAYLFSVKDQSLLSSGAILELGFAASQFRVEERPRGDQTYVITPDGTSGNFFETGERRAGRIQWVTGLVLPSRQWHGRHELKLGTGLDRITTREFFRRNPYLILREDGTRARMVSFVGTPSFDRNNLEAGAYGQDRWSLSDRLLVESGVRLDWDEIVRSVLPSPRIAVSYLLTQSGDTKLVSGVGVYYDASVLEFISRPLTGQRVDSFYDSTGQTLAVPPVQTSFQVDEGNVKETWFLNWSAGIERRLPKAIYLRVEYLQKRGHDGWTYFNEGTTTPAQPSGLYVFRNARRDRYDALTLAARHTFKGNHTLFAAYTHSGARSNAVLNFDLDSPLFSQQAGGPLPWDSPNRVQSWGWLPFVKRFDLAYTLDWRDGYPFSVFNQEQLLVGPPGSRRFPDYFSLNLHLERRFGFLGYQWAFRGGFNNITNRHNASVVDSNVDSPRFLTFGSLDRRALTGRIRLLGRK